MVNVVLKLKRQELGLSQRQLADLVGVHENVVSRWETGRQRPSKELGDLVATIVELPAWELFPRV